MATDIVVNGNVVGARRAGTSIAADLGARPRPLQGALSRSTWKAQASPAAADLDNMALLLRFDRVSRVLAVPETKCRAVHQPGDRRRRGRRQGAVGSGGRQRDRQRRLLGDDPGACGCAFPVSPRRPARRNARRPSEQSGSNAPLQELGASNGWNARPRACLRRGAGPGGREHDHGVPEGLLGDRLRADRPADGDGDAGGERPAPTTRGGTTTTWTTAHGFGQPGTYYYRSAATAAWTAAATSWSSNTVTLSATSGYISYVDFLVSELADTYDYIKVSAGASSTVHAILYDLTVQRTPANLRIPSA